MFETSDVEDIRAMKKALGKDRHCVIYLKWEFDGIGFRKIFGFDPSDVIDVWKTAERLSILSNSTLFAKGSPATRRASFYSDFARPSEGVLILEAAESVGFDIGIEEEKIGEKCVYPVMTCSKDLAPSQTDRLRNSP